MTVISILDNMQSFMQIYICIIMVIAVALQIRERKSPVKLKYLKILLALFIVAAIYFILYSGCHIGM